MCSTARTLLQKMAFPVPELFCGLSNTLISEPEHLDYVDILGPTSQNLECACAFILSRLPKDLSGEVKQRGFISTLYSDSGFRRTVKENCYCN